MVFVPLDPVAVGTQQLIHLTRGTPQNPEQVHNSAADPKFFAPTTMNVVYLERPNVAEPTLAAHTPKVINGTLSSAVTVGLVVLKVVESLFRCQWVFRHH